MPPRKRTRHRVIVCRGSNTGPMSAPIGLLLWLSLFGAESASAQAQLAEPFGPQARWSYYVRRTYGPVRLGLLGADTAIEHALGDPSCWDSAAASYGRRYSRASLPELPEARRARMMRLCAQEIVRNHNARFPKSSTNLRSLPGIGRYTAAAIASIAFSEPVAVVDGNVERVLERLAGRELTVKEIWNEAQNLLTLSRPADHNQAIMELGATICIPRGPNCPACPVKKWCATHASSAWVRISGYQADLAGLLRSHSVCQISLDMSESWTPPSLRRVLLEWR